MMPRPRPADRGGPGRLDADRRRQADAPRRHDATKRNGRVVRYRSMPDDIETLRQAMDAASARLDFEEARRLRDLLNLARGGADADALRSADTSGLTRQQPGRMGLGTSQQAMSPPPGWKPPPKPDPMTRGTARRRGKAGPAD